jgi:hypothetical protein|tara:strand:- start:9913 stop:10020 length:108 start_codon:yes stop_codon:yes gene_type:complete
LTTANSHLDGAHRIDVLVLNGPGPVMEAIEIVVAG